MSFLLDLLCGPARLQECAKHSDAYLTQTAAGFAIVPGSELSHEEMDAAYHAKKVSGGLRVRDDAFALDLQLQTPDAWRMNGGM
jgi:hypothetical protein